jgi:hypothetical protein
MFSSRLKTMTERRSSLAHQPIYSDGDVVNGRQYSAALNQWIPLPTMPSRSGTLETRAPQKRIK